jgi:hypothetical protein
MRERKIVDGDLMTEILQHVNEAIFDWLEFIQCRKYGKGLYIKSISFATTDRAFHITYDSKSHRVSCDDFYKWITNSGLTFSDIVMEDYILFVGRKIFEFYRDELIIELRLN